MNQYTDLLDLTRKSIKIPWTSRLSQFTISMWLKLTWNPSRTSDDKPGNPAWLAISVRRRLLYFQYTKHKLQIGRSWIDYPESTLFNLTMCSGSSDTLGSDYTKVYFNGILVENAVMQWDGHKMYLMKQHNKILYNPHERMQCGIALLLLYNRGLHQEEVKQNYLEYGNRFGVELETGSETPVTNGLIGHYDIKTKWRDQTNKKAVIRHKLLKQYDILVPNTRTIANEPSTRSHDELLESSHKKKTPKIMHKTCYRQRIQHNLHMNRRNNSNLTSPSEIMVLVQNSPNMSHQQLSQIYRLITQQHEKHESFHDFSPELMELVNLLKTRMNTIEASHNTGSIADFVMAKPTILSAQHVVQPIKQIKKPSNKKIRDKRAVINLSSIDAQKRIHGSDVMDLWRRHKKGTLRIIGQCINQSAKVIGMVVMLRGHSEPLYVPVPETKQLKDLPVVALIKSEATCPTSGTGKWW